MCTPKLTPLDRRTASIIGTSTVYGIVSEKEDNIDLAESTEEPALPQLVDGEEDEPAPVLPVPVVHPAVVRF